MHAWTRGIRCFHSERVSVYEWLSAFLIWTWRASTYTSFCESHSLSLSLSLCRRDEGAHAASLRADSVVTDNQSEIKAWGAGLHHRLALGWVCPLRQVWSQALLVGTPFQSLHASIAPGYNGGIPHMTLAFGTDFICFESRWRSCTQREQSSYRNACVFSSSVSSRVSSSSPHMSCFIAPFAVCWIGECPVWGLLNACNLVYILAYSLSLSLSLSLKRKQPPGIEILVSGQSNTVTQKGMNCSPIAFREFLFLITLGLLDVCVCVCVCVCVLVLTTDGKECKFPFRFGGLIYHQCISMSSHKAW